MRAKIIPIRRSIGSIEAISDEALLAACALGDRAALGTLFDRHYHHVRIFLFHLVSCDEADIDDLVQSTFETVQRAASGFQMRSGVKAWILGIARNVARRWLRTRFRQRRIALELVNEVRLVDDTLSEQLVHKERLAKLHAVTQALSPKLREVFILVYLQGLSGTEAAEVLGIREGAVWKRLHAARKKIAAAMGDER